MVKPATGAKDEQGRPMTWDMIKQNKKSPIRKVIIPMDDELAAEWQTVDGKVQLSQLRLNMNIEDPNLKKEVVEELATATARKEELETTMGNSIAVFKFRGLGRKKYEKLKNDNPPTPEQVRLGKERTGETLPWNTDTFPPKVIAACCIEPEITLDHAREMWEADEWTEAELLLLLGAALEVNEQVRNINWGKG